MDAIACILKRKKVIISILMFQDSPFTKTPDFFLKMITSDHSSNFTSSCSIYEEYCTSERCRATNIILKFFTSLMCSVPLKQQHVFHLHFCIRRKGREQDFHFKSKVKMRQRIIQWRLFICVMHKAHMQMNVLMSHFHQS